MDYMVIEHYKEGKIKEIYQRFEERGRMMPDGVEYISSWISDDITVCYQVMRSQDFLLLQEWINNWKDLVDFEVIPVISSAAAKEKVIRSKTG